MVKNTWPPWEEEFSWSKTPKHLLPRPSKRRSQVGLEEERISLPHIDDKNISVFLSSILSVKYISKNGAWPNMGGGGAGGGKEVLLIADAIGQIHWQL